MTTQQNEATLNSPDDEARAQILNQVLSHAVFDGWTTNTLKRAGDDLEKPWAEVQRLCPNGIADMIEAFHTRIDYDTEIRLNDLDLGSMKIRQRIATCVKVRLVIYHPHREAVRRLVSVMALPDIQLRRHVKASLFRTADLMWRAAGDTSTDFNYYTKRGLLVAVYGSTLLYWLDDDSEDYESTWAFLDRRIADVMRIQTVKSRVGKIEGLLPTNMPLSLPIKALNYIPERLPRLIPFVVRKPIEFAGRWARGRHDAN